MSSESQLGTSPQGCIAEALRREEFSRPATDAGAVEVDVTQRVRPHASAAIIRARKPGAA